LRGGEGKQRKKGREVKEKGKERTGCVEAKEISGYGLATKSLLLYQHAV